MQRLLFQANLFEMPALTRKVEMTKRILELLQLKGHRHANPHFHGSIASHSGYEHPFLCRRRGRLIQNIISAGFINPNVFGAAFDIHQDFQNDSSLPSSFPCRAGIVRRRVAPVHGDRFTHNVRKVLGTGSFRQLWPDRFESFGLGKDLRLRLRRRNGFFRRPLGRSGCRRRFLDRLNGFRGFLLRGRRNRRSRQRIPGMFKRFDRRLFRHRGYQNHIQRTGLWLMPMWSDRQIKLPDKQQAVNSDRRKGCKKQASHGWCSAPA